ncbi:hypothetical protein NJ75_03716 [Novosphingobium subterraneum]|uniref:Uncharacterized protein n=1 Tax=Novosphingobium subterraneum TaxID=48936 RepID=A0A0B9A252_9SPHN|nr:hypothetical protein NJ75_03716 [Novosphingobium subterraneum]
MQFREVESVLAHLIGVFPDKRPRFQARLKQLQRLKFPDGVNAGKTARTDYRAEQIFKLALVLELLQAGITPERAISFVKTWWLKIRRGIVQVRNEPRPISIVFWPKDFGGLTDAGDDEKLAWTSNGCALMTLDAADERDLLETAAVLTAQPRTVIINLSRIWHEIINGGALPESGVAEINADVAAWESDPSLMEGVI